MSRVPSQIWALITAAFILALGYGIIAPVLPAYARSFDVGVTAASTIVSAFALMRLLFAPTGGTLILRFGERTVYLAGLLIVAASTAACAFAQSFLQLLVFRAVGGIGSVTFTIAAMALLVRLAPIDLRGRVSALYSTAFLIGNIAGPILGAGLSFLGYRIPFLIYAGALLVAAGVAAAFMRGGGKRPDAPREAAVQLTFREAMRDSAYRALLVTAFANGWGNFGVRIALLPLFAAAVPSLGVPMAGIGLTAFALGNFLALQFTGRAVDDLGRKRIAVMGLVIGGIANVAFGWSTAIPVFLGLSALAGVGASLVAPAQQAAMADIIGRDRSGGQALAAFSMVGDLGATIGPVLAGLLADAVGFGWAFAATGVLMVLSSAAWLPARETLVTDAVR